MKPTPLSETLAREALAATGLPATEDQYSAKRLHDGWVFRLVNVTRNMPLGVRVWVVADNREVGPVNPGELPSSVLERLAGPKLGRVTIAHWTNRQGQHRRYLNKWSEEVLGLRVKRDENHHVCEATMASVKISNLEARRILATKVWLDDSDRIHVAHNLSDSLSDQQIIDAVRDAINAT